MRGAGLTAAGFAAALFVLGGCSSSGSPARITPAAGASAPACAHVPWPSAVGDAERVGTDPESPSTAAWATGKAPAVLARCGVAVPGPTRDECLTVDGVDWVAHRLEDGMRFTTYGRDPAVEVLVPNAFAPEPLLLPGFADAARVGTATGHRCV